MDDILDQEQNGEQNSEPIVGQMCYDELLAPAEPVEDSEEEVIDNTPIPGQMDFWERYIEEIAKQEAESEKNKESGIEEALEESEPEEPIVEEEPEEVVTVEEDPEIEKIEDFKESTETIESQPGETEEEPEIQSDEPKVEELQQTEKEVESGVDEEILEEALIKIDESIEETETVKQEEVEKPKIPKQKDNVKPNTDGLQINEENFKEKSVTDFNRRQKGEEREAGDGGGVILRSLDEVLHNSMIPYTEHVVLDRALPRVEDGLKPVQRRILYSMMELGLFPDKQYRKSAKIVGDCMGNYHPHGDSSVYDAMVRMSQEFSLRAPLIDGHGNFGSIDGDSAAAMRYTEARLTPLSLELLRDLEKDTVKWSYNYDDTRKEPDMLPGRFPNLLVNGASGIAVGVATNIPPHNLGEVIDGCVAYINSPKISLGEMMKIIKAPDFPTGGHLIIGPELEQAYATGKGKVIIRAKAAIETSGDRESIVITELPYQTNKAALLAKIAELKEDNKDKLSAISEIRDESDRNGLRAVIRIKNGGNTKAILAYLFKATGLEVSFGINMVAIADGKPKQMGLLEIISYYVEYQKELIVRRTKFDLHAAKERAHIVEGLLIAIKNIDEVIRIIRKSSSVGEARENLKARFKLSEKQAQAILDMRLSRLVNLEVTKLQDELKELKAKIKEYEEILASKKLQYEVVKTEILDIKKRYKNERRSSLVKNAEIKIETIDENKAFEKDVFVAITAGGTIKKILSRNYSMSVKEISDTTTLTEVHTKLFRCKTTDTVLVFTNKGNCLKLLADKIPEAKWKDSGVALSVIDKSVGEKEMPVSVLVLSEGEDSKDACVLSYSKQGMVKRSKLSDMIVSKAFYQAMKINDGDDMLDAEIDQNGKPILMITATGMSLNFEKTDIPVQGRVSGGVRGINMEDGDYVVYAAQNLGGKLAIATDKGYFKRVDMGEFALSPRYRKGLRCMNLDHSKICFAGTNVALVAADLGAKLQKVSSRQMPESGRLTTGDQVVKKKLLGIYEYTV